MSSNWKTKPLGEVASNVSRRFNFTGKDKVVFINTGDVLEGAFLHSNYSDTKGLPGQAKKAIEKGDILYSEIRPGNKRYVLVDFDPKDYVVSTKFMVIKPTDEILPEFLYLILTSRDCEQEFKIIADSRSGTFPQVTFDSISYFPINFPDKAEQKRILQITDSLSGKLAVNAKTNQTLEQIAQALFKSWFVDFGPVKAKIETLAAGGSADDAELAAMSVISAKTIDELNSLKGCNPEAFNKLAQTAALFPAAMQDSELGEIPEGWSVEQLGDHLNVLQTGSRPKGGVGGITEGVPSVGAENILGVGNYTYGKEKFVSREFFDKLKRGVVEDFDFLLYKDGGKPGEFKPRVSMFGCGFPYSEFAINEHVFRMRSESLGQAFLYFQIGHKRVLDELANRGGKAAIPGINQTDVKTIPVLVPSAADLLTEFNEFAQKIIESILKKSNESNHLVSIRDTLQPKLLNGEIDLTSEVVE